MYVLVSLSIVAQSYETGRPDDAVESNIHVTLVVLIFMYVTLVMTIDMTVTGRHRVVALSVTHSPRAADHPRWRCRLACVQLDVVRTR